MAIDPKLNVLIVHGWDDLSCPFMASVLIVDQMPLMGNPQRVQVKEYPGGHMFYSRPQQSGGDAPGCDEAVRRPLEAARPPLWGCWVGCGFDGGRRTGVTYA